MSPFSTKRNTFPVNREPSHYAGRSTVCTHYVCTYFFVVGLSQLSRAQRVRVCDLSSGGTSQKSASTSAGPEMSPESVMERVSRASSTSLVAEASKASRRASHYHGAQAKRASKPSSASSGSSTAGKTSGAISPLPQKMTDTASEAKIYQLREQIALLTHGKPISSPVGCGLGADTLDEVRSAPDPTKTAQKAGAERDQVRSSVSVKSFSDRDSGYKDDSQPEEG